MKKKTKKTLKKELSHSSTNNSELVYLKELIEDFPCENHFEVNYAADLLKTRYSYLETQIPFLLKKINEGSLSDKISHMFPNTSYEEDKLPKHLYYLMILFHFFLFEDILNNSGEFRKSTDPNNGKIGFGGADRRIVGNLKYPGLPCDKIENELVECFSFLENNSPDPIYSSIKFYRRFVKIHPFYDANGRIGRLILSIYNLQHGYYIKWGEIENGGNKTDFIKKLNSCHDREENKEKYEEYIRYLASFFRKFVITTEELITEGEG